ncbi:MAG: nuclear transport factor 2 family protein [Thermoleophilaceae bacterium]|nr:nuclear transport factor 2 family protein [Thermoleophilaceae bacterium]
MARADDIATLELIYEAWNEGNVARIAERYWSDRIEWHDPVELEQGGIYVGRERVIGRVVGLAADIGVPLLRIERITPLGGEYIVELDFDVVPAAAELPPGSIALVHVARIEGGRVVRLRMFVNADSAFAALADQAARA